MLCKILQGYKIFPFTPPSQFVPGFEVARVQHPSITLDYSVLHLILFTSLFFFFFFKLPRVCCSCIHVSQTRSLKNPSIHSILWNATHIFWCGVINLS